MKLITTVEEYYTMITTEPTYILIYSSRKGCQACHTLKKWMEKEYPNHHRIYMIHISNERFQEMTSDIYALPTIEFRRYTKVERSVEGFLPHVIKEMIHQLETPNDIGFYF